MLRPWNIVLPIDRTSAHPVFMQISDGLIQLIKNGHIQAGEVVPSSRQLALQIQVNRNTVVAALDVLVAEGWLLAKERTGYFVPTNLPIQHVRSNIPPLHKEERTVLDKPVIFFDDGLPDSSLVPVDELARSYRQIFRRKARWQSMGYTNPGGDVEFRKAITQMLNHKRGLRLNWEQVFITRGSQMAMYLTASCLLKQGDYVVVEDPGYKPAWSAFEHAGASLLSIAIDEKGIIVDELKELLVKFPMIKAIYITPHHQYPTTVPLALSRRLELIQLSNKYGFTIIEDDYDHEFHYTSRPIMPVCSLDAVKNYVYIGTLSKVVAPALRIGYLASSPALIEKISALRKIIDVQGDTIMEQAVLQLIKEGDIKRHLRRATNQYRAKRDFFEKILNKHLADRINFIKPEGGLAIWITPKQPTDLKLLITALEKAKIRVLPPETFSDGLYQGLRLGFASLSEAKLEEGVLAIARFWPSKIRH